MNNFFFITPKNMSTTIKAISTSSALEDNTIATMIWKNLHNMQPDIITNLCDWSL